MEKCFEFQASCQTVLKWEAAIPVCPRYLGGTGAFLSLSSSHALPAAAAFLHFSDTHMMAEENRQLQTQSDRQVHFWYFCEHFLYIPIQIYKHLEEFIYKYRE